MLAALAADDQALVTAIVLTRLLVPLLYQSFDKALDIYYLAVAYLSTLRNWRSEPALKIARFLFY